MQRIGQAQNKNIVKNIVERLNILKGKDFEKNICKLIDDVREMFDYLEEVGDFDQFFDMCGVFDLSKDLKEKKEFTNEDLENHILRLLILDIVYEKNFTTKTALLEYISKVVNHESNGLSHLITSGRIKGSKYTSFEFDEICYHCVDEIGVYTPTELYFLSLIPKY